MTKTLATKILEDKGTLYGKALIEGGWTPEMESEYDYLTACFGESLKASGTFTGKRDEKREQELFDLMEAGVYRSLHRLETEGTSEEKIFNQMRLQIEEPKIRAYEQKLMLQWAYDLVAKAPVYNCILPVHEVELAFR